MYPSTRIVYPCRVTRSAATFASTGAAAGFESAVPVSNSTSVCSRIATPVFAWTTRTFSWSPAFRIRCTSAFESVAIGGAGRGAAP